MMKRRKLLIPFLLLVLALPLLSAAEAPYGAAAILPGQNYTVEQMLTYAIQDEYLAQAEYQAFIKAYGTNTAFTNFERAETRHIARLVQLFEARGWQVPVNDAASRLAPAPADILDAFREEVELEKANIAMYELFLTQKDLPEDVKLAFTALRNASRNHLAAAERNVQRNSKTQGYGRGGRRNTDVGSGTPAQGRPGRNRK